MCWKQTRSEVNLWYFHLLKAQLTNWRCLSDHVHSSTEHKQHDLLSVRSGTCSQILSSQNAVAIKYP